MEQTALILAAAVGDVQVRRHSYEGNVGKRRSLDAFRR